MKERIKHYDREVFEFYENLKMVIAIIVAFAVGVIATYIVMQGELTKKDEKINELENQLVINDFVVEE